MGGRRGKEEGGGAREELLFALGLDGSVRVQSVERWDGIGDRWSTTIQVAGVSGVEGWQLERVGV